MQKVMGFLAEDAVVLDMQAGTKDEAIRELIQLVVERGGIPKENQEAVFEAVMDREKRGSTGLGEGLAVPHVKDCPHVEGLTGAFGRSKSGIAFDAVDGQKVDLIFLILGGPGKSGDHIRILQSLASLRQNQHFLRFLRDARDESAVIDTIKDMSGSPA